MSALDSPLALAESNLKRAREELRAVADWLERDMANLINRIDDDKDDLVNSLGEVQGKGREVDRLCTVLSERRDHLKMLQWLKEKEIEDLPPDHPDHPDKQRRREAKA